MSNDDDDDDDSYYFEERVRDRDGKRHRMTFTFVKRLGSGTFGIAKKFQVQDLDRRDKRIETVAVKFPSDESDGLDLRELELLLILDHVNVCGLRYFFERSPKYVIVLDLVEGGDLLNFLQKHFRKGDLGILVQLFAFQLFRGLAYCHIRKVCHRDVKPENILVDPERGTLKIADFGCGTVLTSEKEVHTYYVGTRIFRAPELLLGASSYTLKVDCWSGAVVITETVLGHPIFYNSNSRPEHIVKIFEYLGLPTPEDFAAMKVKRIPLPRLKTNHSFSKTFLSNKNAHDVDALIDLLTRVLVYSPSRRLSAWEVCAHNYFDVLKDRSQRLPNKRPLPNIYDFSAEEIASMPLSVRKTLVQGRAHKMSIKP